MRIEYYYIHPVGISSIKLPEVRKSRLCLLAYCYLLADAVCLLLLARCLFTADSLLLASLLLACSLLVCLLLLACYCLLVDCLIAYCLLASCVFVSTLFYSHVFICFVCLVLRYNIHYDEGDKW